MPTISGKWLFNETLSQPSANISAKVKCENFESSNGFILDKISLFHSDHFGVFIMRYYFGDGSFEADVYFFSGNKLGWSDEKYRNLDFGTTPQTVSDEFYDWFVANASCIEFVSGTWSIRNLCTVISAFFKNGALERVSFVSNGKSFSSIKLVHTKTEDGGDLEYYDLMYDDVAVACLVLSYDTGNRTIDSLVEKYRTIKFDGTQTVTKEFYDWVGYNFEQQPEEEQPTAPAKKFTRLYVGGVVASSGVKCFKRLSSTQTIEIIIEVSYDASDGAESDYVYIDNVTTGKRLFSASGKTVKTASINVHSTDELSVDCLLSTDVGSAIVIYDNERNYIGGSGGSYKGTLPLFTGYTLADVKSIFISSYY